MLADTQYGLKVRRQQQALPARHTEKDNVGDTGESPPPIKKEENTWLVSQNQLKTKKSQRMRRMREFSLNESTLSNVMVYMNTYTEGMQKARVFSPLKRQPYTLRGSRT